MVEFEYTSPRTPRTTRVQWGDTDTEAGGRRLSRTNSIATTYSTRSWRGSLDIVPSRRASIDPASVLPIQYRTVSFQIEETKEKAAAEAQKAKDSAAEGRSTSSLITTSADEVTRICESGMAYSALQRDFYTLVHIAESGPLCRAG
jgi:sodium/potassium-transporting ATPase subunit alpha